MAEEATTLEEGGEGATPLEEESGATAEVLEESQPNPIEALAAKGGWTPKDQWRGDPDAWKPADEFLLIGKDKISTVTRELRSVRAQMDNMSRTSAALLEQQLEQQRAELEARFNTAVEEGDHKAARQITDRISQLDTMPAARGPSPEGLAWVEKHSSWFGKDREATAYAANRTDHYAQQGLSPARQLQAVEKDMRELFPELFPAPAKPPATVAQPGSRTAATSGRKKGFHDLPAEAQAVAKDMKERGVIPNVDIYVENYFKNAERKVG